MDFGNNFVVVNGILRTKDEARKLYYDAFDYNMVTLLIPDNQEGFIFYPQLNLGYKGDKDYYTSLGHAKCFEKINDLLLRDKMNNYAIKDFGKIQSRTFIASKFVEKGAGVIMRTSKDNFVLIFPGLNDNREKNILMCDNALKLIDLLKVDLTKGCFQINGQIIFNIEDFKEYYNLLKTYDHPKKRYRRISK